MENVKNWKSCPVCSSDLNYNSESRFQKCIKCDREYYQNPIMAAGVVFWNEKGQIMLVERAKDPEKGKFTFPGGFVEIKEKVEEAVKREVEEELGINIDMSKLRYLMTTPNVYKYKKAIYDNLDIFFEMELSDDLISKVEVGDDVISFKFVNLNSIDDKEIAFNSVKETIKLLKERNN